jgi:hypothetical protein
MKQFDFDYPHFSSISRDAENCSRSFIEAATEDEFVEANQGIVKSNGKVYSRLKTSPAILSLIHKSSPRLLF